MPRKFAVSVGDSYAWSARTALKTSKRFGNGRDFRRVAILARRLRALPNLLKQQMDCPAHVGEAGSLDLPTTGERQ